MKKPVTRESKIHRVKKHYHLAKRHMEGRPILHAFFKVFIVSISCIIMLVGIAMLVLPGPGLLVIFGGLALLATEVPWAHRWVRILKLKWKRILYKARLKFRRA